MENREFITTAELAKILGISRVAVFKRIKRGQIKAIRVGRNFAIPRDSLPEVLGQVLSKKTKGKLKPRSKRQSGNTARPCDF